MHLGFVGIGHMGAPMAGRLLDAGHTLVIFDTNASAMAPLAARGATVATSAEDVASQAEIVFMSLPTPPIVQAVSVGDKGILRGTKVKTLIDLSTTGPSMAAIVGKAAAEKGPSGLSHADLSGSVFNALSLNFSDYAADPDIRGPARTSTNDALRRVIQYHVYRDLQRLWRVTAPNLEDCGLLRFEYEGLAGTEGLLE